jgi:hypothetical protein
MIEPRLLHAYLDGELSEGETREVEQRLAQCQASQNELDSIRSVKTLLAMKAEPQMCEATWTACRSRLDELDRIEKSGNLITRFSWAFALGVAVIVFVGGTLSRNAQQGTVGNDMLAGIVSSSRKPRFDVQELDNRLKAADVNLLRAQVLGAREFNSFGQDIVELQLQDASGEMTLLILGKSNSFENLEPFGKTKYLMGQISTKQNCLAWQTQNKSYVLLGMRDHADLLRSAQVNQLPVAE